MPTPYAALRAAVTADPSRPLVTYVGPEGRTELSVRSCENNVAKAAGLLRDGLDVQPGDPVGLLLGPHWQAAVWLGACWAVGAVAVFAGAGDAAGAGEAARADVVVAFDERLDEATGAGELLRVSRHPFGLPSTQPLPVGVLEAATEVRAYSDVFTPYQPPADDDPALRCAGTELRAGQVMAAGADLAARCGLRPGGRLLVTGTAGPLDLALALTAAPLAVAAAVVLAPTVDDRVGTGVDTGIGTGADTGIGTVARAEHVTARLT